MPSKAPAKDPTRTRTSVRAPAARRNRSSAEPDGEIDRLIHEPVRLRIMSALAVTDSLSFNELRDLLDATDGNLSVHARKLEDAKYLRCTKEFDGRVPKTTYVITDLGRRTLESYLRQMEAIIRSARTQD